MSFFRTVRTSLFRVWFRLSRPMTLGARGVIENETGQVLLVRHTYTPGLLFPGGGVERGETALEALCREVQEEAGVRPVAEPQLHAIYSNHFLMKNDHVILFRLPPGSWETCATDSAGEISERVWIDPFAPPEDVTPATLRRLKELFAEGGRNAYW